MSKSIKHSINRRCFIVDPVCAITYGHSLNSLIHFSSAAKYFYDEIHVYASRHLPEFACKIPIIRFFEFYYDPYIKIKRRPLGVHEIGAECFDSMDDLAACDFYRLFSEVAIRSEDTVIFPSADFHGLMGAINALNRLPEGRRPRLFVRLINVMENIHLSDSNTLSLPIQRAIASIHTGARIYFAAETPKYARRLSEISGIAVATVPYPALGSDLIPMNPVGPFGVLCGGSGRADKGFFRLINIIESVNSLVSNVKFIIQNLHPSQQLENIDYINRLYAIPNVVLIPGLLSYSEIIDSYTSSHVTLMPYDPDIYMYRGSAMLMESIFYGRPCIVQSGTAFAEQVERYQCGIICNKDHDIVQAVALISISDRAQLSINAAQSKNFYADDVDKDFANWLSLP